MKLHQQQEEFSDGLTSSKWKQFQSEGKILVHFKSSLLSHHELQNSHNLVDNLNEISNSNDEISIAFDNRCEINFPDG